MTLRRGRRSKVKFVPGTRVGWLTVLAATDERRAGYIVYRCVCRCGTEKLVPSRYLIGKMTRSCGCLKAQPKLWGTKL